MQLVMDDICSSSSEMRVAPHLLTQCVLRLRRFVFSWRRVAPRESEVSSPIEVATGG